MAAWPSVMAGKNVLMIERGDWVARGPHNRGADGFFALTPAYSAEAPYRVLAGGDSDTLGTIACVGGASVFFGGVSLRLRERDFEADPEIVGDSGAEWPYRYADLEPFYSKAEQLLGVAGTAGQDPTEPWRSAAYPQAAPPRAAMSDRIARAAQSLGLHPFALPLAINYTASASRQACVACNTCDGFACAYHAKNDLSATIPDLQARGLRLETNTVAVRLRSARQADRRGGVRGSAHASTAPVCRPDRRRRRRRSRHATPAAGVRTRADESGRRCWSAAI